VRVTTEADARQVLIHEQLRSGGVRTIPDSSATLETEAGWAFFNVNGYLGTVTDEGDVLVEPELEEAE
jgi:hypothetical protein